MTLVFRLAVLVLAGLAVAVLTYFLLWPAGSHSADTRVGQTVESEFSADRFAGKYTAKNQTGSYRLVLASDGKATLDFTDRKGRHFAYQGEIVEGKIIWRQTLKAKKWVDLAQPVDDGYSMEPPSTVITREGRFNRVQK